MVDFKPDEELETQEFDAVDNDGRQVPEWVKTIGKVLAVLILVVLLVLGGRWLHHELANKTTNKPAPTTTEQKPASTGNGLSVNGGVKSGSGNGSGANNTQQSNPPVGPGKNASDNLPNTGPGDVIAIFVGSSLAAAALHYAYSPAQAKRLRPF